MRHISPPSPEVSSRRGVPRIRGDDPESLSSRLMELPGKVADSLQAAQVLHGAAVAESEALESEESKECD